VESKVSLAQASSEETVLPERIQEALGQLVGAALEMDDSWPEATHPHWLPSIEGAGEALLSHWRVGERSDVYYEMHRLTLDVAARLFLNIASGADGRLDERGQRRGEQGGVGGRAPRRGRPGAGPGRRPPA